MNGAGPARRAAAHARRMTVMDDRRRLPLDEINAFASWTYPDLVDGCFPGLSVLYLREGDEGRAFPASGDGYQAGTLPGQSGRTYTVQRTRCASTSKSGAGWWLARSSRRAMGMPTP